jgi:recombination protein RecA
MAKTTKNTSDDLSHIIANALKAENITAYFVGEEDTPTDLKDFISTGSSILDLAIANRKHGGIACGRITELQGLEGSGKSLIAGHLMKSVQDEGGIAVLIDTETALNEDFFESIGLDMTKMVYVHTNILEEVFESIERIITKVREGTAEARKKKVIIVVDSVAAASPKKEMESDFDQEGYATQKAIIIGKAMRKLTALIAREKIALVVCNQLRHKMNAQPFADQWTTSGGKAIGFHCSTRVRLSLTGQIKNANKDIIGVTIEAKITKNRLGPPHRKANLEVYFDRGIDDITSWIKYLNEKDIIKGAAGNWTFVDSKGVEHKFKTGAWSQFTKDNPTVFQEIYDRMADSMIMQYKSDGLSTLDEAEISAATEEE